MTNRAFPYLNSASVEQLRSVTRVSERILITGGGGWFGRTLALMLHELGIPFLLIGSRERAIELPGATLKIHQVTSDIIKAFEPTFLVDLAFLTREHLPKIGSDEFTKINRGLILQALEFFRLPSIQGAIFFSSGAALQADFSKPKPLFSDAYGALKHETELLAREVAVEESKKLVIARPWSVSGTLVEPGRGFAFESLISQSKSGLIQIGSKVPVLRRFVSVEDFFAVCFSALSRDSQLDLVESGGELIDILHLAQRIAEAAPNKVRIVHQIEDSSPPNAYFSNNENWCSWLDSFGFEAESLGGQISRNLEVAHSVALRH